MTVVLLVFTFCFFFFFFQAEDGIRDLTVTGVQTCALPISASWPSPTSATIANPSCSSRALRPWRTIRWSSARRIRVGTACLHRYANDQLGPASWDRGDVQGSPDRVQPLLDSDEAEAARAPARLHGEDVEPRTVVANRAAQEPTVPREPDRHAACLGVLGDVGQRLLDDPVQGRLGRRGHALARHSLDRDLQPRSPRDAIGEKLDRRVKAEIVEDRRAQLVGEVSELLFDLGQ